LVEGAGADTGRLLQMAAGMPENGAPRWLLAGMARLQGPEPAIVAASPGGRKNTIACPQFVCYIDFM